jgi:trimeric autotransporter adhesin
MQTSLCFKFCQGKTTHLKTLAATLLLWAIQSFSQAATFTVTNTTQTTTGNCGATCSLSQAASAALATPGFNTIRFDIAGSGPHEFNFPVTAASPVFLDGYSQLGSVPNNLPQGSNAVLKIRFLKRLEFTPNAMGSAVSGIEFINLDLAGSNSTSLFNNANSLQVLGCHFAGRNTSIVSQNQITVGSVESASRNMFFSQRSIVLSQGQNSTASNSVIVNNVFGRSLDLSSVVPIGDAIQLIAGNNIRIGGVGGGEGNVFSGASVNGAVFFSGGSTGVQIRGNRFSNNTPRPIGFFNGFPVPNDLDDVDTGPNGLQNFPVITSITRPHGGVVRIAGTLDRPASFDSRTYDIDFYLSATCHASGRGEGDAFFRTIAFTSTGPADESFSTTFVTRIFPIGSVVTAIATERATGNSSEFSACFVVP